MKKLFVSLCALMLTCSMFASQADRQGLTEYKLPNGLTVILWEDHDQPDVEGYIAVRAGSIDEPQEYTGLAHYLEHMLFKGTDRIGAIDWEAEKPHYENIIRLYDEYSDATDPKVRAELATKINEESMEAAKYATCEDFFILLDGIGATGVNAYTSYDMTCYHNSFPSNQMLKWLTIFADRLRNPVFRTFQAELENVFEEYNMYQDYPSTHIRTNLFGKLYEGHPYERDVIGKPEHLKNPRLSRLIEFYNTWYVPNNMALIIVGDFDTESTKPMIESTFGTFEPKELPARAHYDFPSLAKNPKYSYKIGYNPMVVWAYDGVAEGHEDQLALEMVLELLSNSASTGFFDKLEMDGTISGADASLDARRDGGRIIIEAIPYYDINQRAYESNSATERIIMAEINKIKSGDIPDWLFQSVKAQELMSVKTLFETSNAKMSLLVNQFIYGEPLDDIFTLEDKINAITKEDLQRIAKKYFDAPHMTVAFEEGDPKKDKLPKPDIKPLDLINGVETEYAKAFKALPEGEIKQTFMDFNDVQVIDLDENVRLHYAANPKNDIFSLRLRYGIGTEKKPMLQYVASLMNMSGIMPSTTPQDFRKQLSELGGYCGYGVDDSYFYVAIEGEEKNLDKICQLVQRQMLFPKFEERQFEAIKGSALSSRYMMQKMDEVQSDALMEYVIYGKESEYLTMVPFMDIYYLDEAKLKTQFLSATKYALDIHYCGQRPLAEVQTVLTANLPLKEGMKPSTSPEIRDKQTYDKTQIYFLANNKVQQATIYFYFNGQPYDKDQAVLFQAFNQYFSGGFTGLVLDEIREKRSMAYTASGDISRGALPGKNSYFIGYIGTQHDKVADAIDVYMDLLRNMPEHPERIEAIKAALRQYAQISKPSFRGKSATYDRWREMGYEVDPAQYNMEAINNLTFDQIMDFYKTYIQSQPVTMIVVGDPKIIDVKRLEKSYGKFIKPTKGKMFAPLDLDF